MNQNTNGTILFAVIMTSMLTYQVTRILCITNPEIFITK